MKMKAAVVRSFEHPPRYEEFELAEPGESGGTLLDVLAVGLHPRVRSGASGAHYTSTGRLPMVPGVDGVARAGDGRLLYFVTADELLGSMAERTLVDMRRTVALPEGTDPLRVAATMNPAMSSWVALRRRVPLARGQSVLILGATGNAGQMAVRIAKHLGAGRVVGAGRDPGRLAALSAAGADAVVQLVQDTAATSAALAEAAGDVDVVLDYLWGAPAASAMMTLARSRTDRSHALNWIQIGAIAGPTIELPSVALRSANLKIQGNGQGAVSPDAYLAELPSLVDQINDGVIALTPRPVALADVEAAWKTADASGERTVFEP